MPFENLVGRAEAYLLLRRKGEPAWEFWEWPWTVRWDRMFEHSEIDGTGSAAATSIALEARIGHSFADAGPHRRAR